MRNSFQYIYEKLEMQKSLKKLLDLFRWVKFYFTAFESCIATLYLSVRLYKGWNVVKKLIIFLQHFYYSLLLRITKNKFMAHYLVVTSILLFYCFFALLAKGLEQLGAYVKGWNYVQIFCNNILYDFFIFILIILKKVLETFSYLLGRIIFKLRNFIFIILVIYYWSEIKDACVKLKSYFPNNEELGWQNDEDFDTIFKYTRDYDFNYDEDDIVGHEDMSEWKLKFFHDMNQVFWHRPVYKGFEAYSENVALPPRAEVGDDFIDSVSYIWNIPIPLPVFNKDNGYLANVYGNWLNYAHYVRRVRFLSENDAYFENIIDVNNVAVDNIDPDKDVNDMEVAFNDYDYKREPDLLFHYGGGRHRIRNYEFSEMMPFFNKQANQLMSHAPVKSEARQTTPYYIDLEDQQEEKKLEDVKLEDFFTEVKPIPKEPPEPEPDFLILDEDLRKYRETVRPVDMKDGPKINRHVFFEDYKAAMNNSTLHYSNTQSILRKHTLHSASPTGLDMLKGHWPKPADFFHLRSRYMSPYISLEQVAKLNSSSSLLNKLSLWEDNLLYFIMEVLPADVLLVKWKYDILDIIVTNPYYLSNKLEYFFYDIDLNTVFMINNLAISFIVYEISDLLLAKIIIYPKLMLSVLVNLIFDKFAGEVFGHMVLGDRVNFVMPVINETGRWANESFDEVSWKNLVGGRTITNYFNVAYTVGIPFDSDMNMAFGKSRIRSTTLDTAQDFSVLTKPSYPALAFYSPSSEANHMFNLLWEEDFSQWSQFGEDLFENQLRPGWLVQENFEEDYRLFYIESFSGFVLYFFESLPFFWDVLIISGFLEKLLIIYILIKAYINCMKEFDRRLDAFRRVCEMAGVVYRPWDGKTEKFYDFFEDIFKNEILDTIPNTDEFNPESYFRWWDFKNKLININKMKGFFKRTDFFEKRAYFLVLNFILSFPFLFIFHLIKVTYVLVINVMLALLTLLLYFVILLLNVFIDFLVDVIRKYVIYFVAIKDMFCSEHRVFRIVRFLWWFFCRIVYSFVVFWCKFFFIIYWFIFNGFLIHFINFILDTYELRLIDTRCVFLVLMFFFFDILWFLCVLSSSFKNQLFCSEKNPDIVSPTSIDWDTWVLVTDLDPFDHNEQFTNHHENADNADEVYEHLIDIYEDEDDEDDEEDDDEEEFEALEETPYGGLSGEDGDEEDVSESSTEVSLFVYDDKDMLDWANYNNWDETEKRLVLHKFFKKYMINSFHLERGYSIEDRWIVELMLNRFYNPVITKMHQYNDDLRQLPLSRIETNLNEYSSSIDYDPLMNLTAMYGQPDEIKKYFREMLKTGRLNSYPYLVFNTPFVDYEWNENLQILVKNGQLYDAFYIEKKKPTLEELKEEEKRKKQRESFREEMIRKGYQGAFPFIKHLDKEIIINPIDIEARTEDVESYEEFYSYRIDTENNSIANNNVYIVNHYDFNPSVLPFEHYTLDITQAFDNKHKYEFFCDLNFYKMYLGLEHLPRVTREEMDRICAFIGCTLDDWKKVDPEFKKHLFKATTSLPFYNFSFPLYCFFMLFSFMTLNIYRMYSIPLKGGLSSETRPRVNVFFDYYLMKDFFYETVDFFKNCWFFWTSGMWREYYDSVLNIYDSPEHYYRRYLMEHTIAFYEAYDNKYKHHFYTEMPLLNRWIFKGNLYNVPPYLTEDELLWIVYKYQIPLREWNSIDREFISQVDRNNEDFITSRMIGIDEIYRTTIGIDKNLADKISSRSDEVRRLVDRDYTYFTKNYESYSDALFHLFYLRLYDHKGRIVPFNEENRLKYGNVLERGYFSESGLASSPNYYSYLNLKFANFTNLARMRLIEKFSVHNLAKHNAFNADVPDYLTTAKRLQFIFGKGKKWVVDIPHNFYAKWREEVLDEHRELGYFDVFHPISFRAVRLLHFFDRFSQYKPNINAVVDVVKFIFDIKYDLKKTDDTVFDDIRFLENKLKDMALFFKNAKPIKRSFLDTWINVSYNIWPQSHLATIKDKLSISHFYPKIKTKTMFFDHLDSSFKVKTSKLRRHGIFRSHWYPNEEEVIKDRLSQHKLLPLDHNYDDFYFPPFYSYNKLYDFFINYYKNGGYGNMRSFLTEHERRDYYKFLVSNNLGFSLDDEQIFDSLEVWDFNIQNLGVFSRGNYTPSFYLNILRPHAFEMIVPELWDEDEQYWIDMNILFEGAERGPNNPDDFDELTGGPEETMHEYVKTLRKSPELRADTTENRAKIRKIVEMQLYPTTDEKKIKEIEEMLPAGMPKDNNKLDFSFFDVTIANNELTYTSNYFDFVMELEKYLHFNGDLRDGLYTANTLFAHELLENKRVLNKYTSASYDFLPSLDFIRGHENTRSFLEDGYKGEFLSKFRRNTIRKFGVAIDTNIENVLPGWLHRLGIKTEAGFFDFLLQYYLRPAGHAVNPYGGLQHGSFFILLKYVKKLKVSYDIHISVYWEAWSLIYKRLKWRKEWEYHSFFSSLRFLQNTFHYISCFFEEYCSLVYVLYLKYKTVFSIYLKSDMLFYFNEISNFDDISDFWFFFISNLFVLILYIVALLKIFFYTFFSSIFTFVIIKPYYLISFFLLFIFNIIYDFISQDVEKILFSFEFVTESFMFDIFFYVLSIQICKFEILITSFDIIYNIFTFYLNSVLSDSCTCILLFFSILKDIYTGKFLISQELDVSILSFLLCNLDILFILLYDLLNDLFLLFWYDIVVDNELPILFDYKLIFVIIAYILQLKLTFSLLKLCFFYFFFHTELGILLTSVCFIILFCFCLIKLARNNIIPSKLDQN